MSGSEGAIMPGGSGAWRLVVTAIVSVVIGAVAAGLWVSTGMSESMKAERAQIEADQSANQQAKDKLDRDRADLAAQQAKLQQEKEKLEAATAKAKEEARAAQESIRNASANYQNHIDSILDHVREVLSKSSSENSENLIATASALVSTRKAFRDALKAVEANLDGDFDRIESELGAGKPDAERLRQLLRNLNEAWPAKRTALTLAIGEVLRQLGMGA
jgi:chromosome segregation ATPase